MKPWKVLNKKTLLERRWLTITEERVELPNGAVIDDFHLARQPDWTAVLAVTGQGRADDDVILVEQYRHGLGRASLELPAGVVDAGESPMVAAQRELREETGYASEAWQPLVMVAPEPARATHRGHFFFASGATIVGPAQPESSEVIAVRRLPLGALMSEIESGHLIHAAHMAAVLLAARRGLVALGPA